ncbi:MAG: class I SAM-dependent methyltransferase [Planctomycetes bacterium]|nr:class I SAM-dependent methyltransferase [Planctomycetota bacterium]
MLWTWTGNEFTARSWRRSALGADCLLVCPGPSLRDVDPASLRVPGAFTLAINTAYPRVRPDVWVGMDPPECYEGDLFWQPFPKVCGSKYSETEFLGRPIKTCPNTYFATARKDKAADRPWMMFEAGRLAENPDFVWVGATIWTALHVAVWMGARRIFLVGADFGGAAAYHDGRSLPGHLEKSNLALMDREVADLPMVRMAAMTAGVEIISTSPVSRANDALEFVPLERALAMIRAALPSGIAEHERVHAYIAENGRWSERAAGDGFLTGADVRTEWMLPWWLANLRRHHPAARVAFGDFGLSDESRRWCAAHGQVLDLTMTRLAGWLNKPLAILKTPFERTLWLDTDAEVRGPLAGAFDFPDALGGFAAAPDGHNPADAGAHPVNTGVLAVRHGDPRVTAWVRAILAEPARWRGDQEALNALVAAGLEAPDPLARCFNWLRLAGPPPADALVLHHTGPAGKDAIRPAAARYLGFRGTALAERLRARYGGEPIAGAEIGVLAGKTSAALLAALPALHLTMVDSWEPPAAGSRYAASGDAVAAKSSEDLREDMRTAVRATDFAGGRRRILRGTSVEMARLVPDASLDFVFLDAEHTRAAVAEDLAAWWPKVRAGGIVSGHDWDNPDGPAWGVQAAVETFLAEHAPGSAVDLGPDVTWFVQKVAPAVAAADTPPVPERILT